jgi:hypothetical protein
MPRKPQSLSDRLTQTMGSVMLIAVGVFTMLSERLGREPFQMKGQCAVVMGALFVAYGVAMYLMAWLR